MQYLYLKYADLCIDFTVLAQHLQFQKDEKQQKTESLNTITFIHQHERHMQGINLKRRFLLWGTKNSFQGGFCHAASQ